MVPYQYKIESVSQWWQLQQSEDQNNKHFIRTRKLENWAKNEYKTYMQLFENQLVIKSSKIM